MVRASRPGRFVSSLLAIAAVVGLGVVSITPVQAATNLALGDLTSANPAANKYAGCVASVLTGTGITFGSPAALGADLAAVWSTLPAGVADTCKLAVDSNQPQVCVNPADPATCPAIGAATATALADQAVGLTGSWKLVTDGIGTGGYAQTPLATSGPSAPMATVSATFTNPVYNCTSLDCATLPPVGLFTDCGPTSCGPVTSMTVSFVGRTPNGENGVLGHAHAVDGFGNVIDVSDIYGLPYQGTGSGAVECVFSSRLQWPCKDGLNGLPANCGGQTLSVSFTLSSGAGGDCGCAGVAPALGQVAEIQLGAHNLNFAQNPTVCAATLDCLRYDDPRLSYLDGSARPTVVLTAAPAPSAVNDLVASDTGCLVGVDVNRNSAISCLDVTGAFAPLLQTAHGAVVPAGPPTVTGSASPSGGWERTPVTISLTASGDQGLGISSISYSASGAQATPETSVPGSTAQVVVSADGATTVTFWATDTAGASSTAQSIAVQVDGSAPAGAAPSATPSLNCGRWTGKSSASPCGTSCPTTRSPVLTCRPTRGPTSPRRTTSPTSATIRSIVSRSIP